MVLFNSLKLVKKDIEDIRVVVNGGGLVGLFIIRKFLLVGVKYVMVVDWFGIINDKDWELLVFYYKVIVKLINREF